MSLAGMMRTFVRDPKDPICYCKPFVQCGFCYHTEHGKFRDESTDETIAYLRSMADRQDARRK